MRIVGGEFAGVRWRRPDHAIRPTTARTRERVQWFWSTAFRKNSTGARVLDLFAGTGALASRRVARCLLRRLHRGIGRRRGLNPTNAKLRADRSHQIFSTRRWRLWRGRHASAFGLVFADRPTARAARARVLSAKDGGWLLPGRCACRGGGVGTVRAGRGFAVVDERGYGETVNPVYRGW